MSSHPIRAASLPPPNPGWYGLLETAVAPEEVLEMVRDFVARWSPAELAKLPPHLRPGKFFDASDVTEYALDLVRQQQFSMDPRSSPQLHAMANFFSSASSRLSHLLASHGNDEERVR